MNAGGGTTREAVENVVWMDKMPSGAYKVVVNNYAQRETGDVGFVIEIENAGRIEHYNKSGRSATRRTSRWPDDINGGVIGVSGRVRTSAGHRRQGQVGTQHGTVREGVRRHVLAELLRGSEVGNRHYFLVLKGCENDQLTRGIYNEFLRGDLKRTARCSRYRRQDQVRADTDQLSGLGFSSTVRSSVVAKVTMTGGRRRLISIQF